MAEIPVPINAPGKLPTKENPLRFRIDTSLPDISFFRQLSIQGRLRYFQVTDLNANPISIVPPSGETFFFYRALFTNIVGVKSTIAITNNGNPRFSQKMFEGAAGMSPWVVEFIDSLVGNGSKSFDFTATDATSNIELSAFGWVENTSRIRDVTT